MSCHGRYSLKTSGQDHHPLQVRMLEVNLVFSSYFVNFHLSRSPASLIICHIPREVMTDDPGILKWVEIEDKPDRHHLHHDPIMTLDLNLACILRNFQVFLTA